jgi:hypothetical protein
MRRTYDVMLSSIEVGGYVHRATIEVGSGNDRRWVGMRTDPSYPTATPDPEIRRRLWQGCVKQLRKEF